jgi:hypothetical protein
VDVDDGAEKRPKNSDSRNWTPLSNCTGFCPKALISPDIASRLEMSSSTIANSAR